MRASTSASLHGGDQSQAGGSAYIFYYFEVSGPRNGVTVPLVVKAGGTAVTSATGTANVQGNFAIPTIFGALTVCTNQQPNCDADSSGTIFIEGQLNVQSNTAIEIVLGTGGATTGTEGNNTGSFSSSLIGPNLEIEPAWLASHHGYRVVYSQGIVPVQPSPSAASPQ
jgi:hypothetical protein